MIKRALISVFDKTNVLDFAKFLVSKDVEIISSGGTYKYLKENGIDVIEVSEVTKSEEMLDGRVKTLHPAIHGGILALRDNESHMKTIKERQINTIDLVCVNLYPFFEKVKEDLTFEEKVEFIDIGGPSMIRSAAKNFKDVLVVSDINDYSEIMKQINEQGEVDYATRKKFAAKVFNLTSAYDAAISKFLLENDEIYEEYLSASYIKSKTLRYGENPHQSAAVYKNADGSGMMNNIIELNGKELSYNNIKDMDIAWKVVNEFEEIACCGLKHNSPCGVAIGETVKEAYIKAYECDPISIFGGIVAINNTVDKDTAEEMVKTFLEIIIAPNFTEEALDVLKRKKNLRIIKCNSKPMDNKEMVTVDGGVLVQTVDNKLIDEIKVVTKKSPSEEEMKDLIIGMKVAKYVKSNAIVVVKEGKATGIAGGQVNRIWATAQALERGEGGFVLASDAFFPFRDCVDEAAKSGIKAIIQPGGSVRDEESIKACDEQGISMVFTGLRHFKH
ncbi:MULTISPECIES: bifunctional phosphoribosylaminoimidazolecarboxamide formyltransferase/IMP cyclohydrolase [unclassified Clostridium]|uniref:bifunctional phosphoribosylaminoimidazolecarboxamide formyltransferase/IMP cyclohydrolase n=1 Tax=unclassified Clostridium TaxID=2614128 RepID=UPI0025C0C899|nr:MULTISPECIES: bifunctional phosphoribosylaminoimidazolecarboxamide formyltransferase/IMP cyclohydrolase [unclassified Clostridium]